MQKKTLTDFDQLLTPETLSSVSGLELLAKIIVDGYLSGQNSSMRLGAGMEFSQYRAYQPGDDLRLLDWKVLARTGRYYIREAEIETNLSTTFIVDLSASMLHSENKMSKLDYAKTVLAALGYLSIQQGDQVRLYGMNDGSTMGVPPGIGKSQLHRFLSALIKMNGEGRWPHSKNATEKIHDRRRKELIIFVTDMYQHGSELLDFVGRLKTKRNEVVLLHIMGQQELTFDYQGAVTFLDLESNQKVKVDTQQAKTDYRQRVDSYINELKQKLSAKDIYYELVSMGQFPSDVLSTFLQKRKSII